MSWCNMCNKGTRELGDVARKMCMDCKVIYEWQYDTKVIFKNLVSYDDYLNGIKVANILAPDEV